MPEQIFEPDASLTQHIDKMISLQSSLSSQTGEGFHFYHLSLPSL
ncbi:hypothetical protein EFW57_01550 [Bacillus velezensis]|nr:hypothetical protein EFW57_01550 [Bacillus velezensis]